MDELPTYYEFIKWTAEQVAIWLITNLDSKDRNNAEMSILERTRPLIGSDLLYMRPLELKRLLHTTWGRVFNILDLSKRVRKEQRFYFPFNVDFMICWISEVIGYGKLNVTKFLAQEIDELCFFDLTKDMMADCGLNCQDAQKLLEQQLTLKKNKLRTYILTLDVHIIANLERIILDPQYATSPYFQNIREKYQNILKDVEYVDPLKINTYNYSYDRSRYYYKDDYDKSKYYYKDDYEKINYADDRGRNYMDDRMRYRTNYRDHLDNDKRFNYSNNRNRGRNHLDNRIGNISASGKGFNYNSNKTKDSSGNDKIISTPSDYPESDGGFVHPVEGKRISQLMNARKRRTYLDNLENTEMVDPPIETVDLLTNRQDDRGPPVDTTWEHIDLFNDRGLNKYETADSTKLFGSTWERISLDDDDTNRPIDEA